MTLTTAEFIPQIPLIDVLPQGFHRIRHYGLLASGTRADNIAQARRLLDVRATQTEAGDANGAEANEPKPLSAPVSVLRRSYDDHREVPARLLTALPSRDFHRRDQDRHIMIKIGARQNYKTARPLRLALDQQ